MTGDLTDAEYALVLRCASAVCYMCGDAEKWMPASWDEGDYYHAPKSGRNRGHAEWCDANAIWHEVWDDPQPEPDAPAGELASLPLFAQAGR